ncbi:uncharacterized protein LOC132735248 [Ruditapes philippinarum]|uniref:uncharacterized protein LOC132735248 n=1 Tax=Ruditapes philippinarum TaxID=129788 RepID=UPI00295A66A2|nr:uncharacterized protein LOC132735248 [Ruditapes philippinarum]
MDVSGRKFNEGNVHGHICKICGDNDYRIQAFGFCHNCKIYLCRKCFESHKKDKRSSFHHAVKSDPVNANDPLPPCSKHENEVIKFYCRAHEDLGCNVCMLQHKNCETDYIPDVSTQFTNFEEYLNIEVCIQELKGKISEGLDKLKENAPQYKKSFQLATETFRAIKRKITEHLDKFEKELEEEALSYIKASDDKLAKLKFDLDVLENEVSNTADLMTNLKKQNKNNLQFLEAKRAEKKISDYFMRIYEISTRNTFDNIIFSPSNRLSDFITCENVLGTLKLVGSELGPCRSLEMLETRKPSYINIKSESDRKTCYATGLAFLSPDHLAIADKANKNVKIVDVSHDQIVSHIELTSSPRDITVIPPDQLAVTLRDEERIQLLSTRKGVTKAEQIRTAGNCRGIKYDDGKLIVAFDGKVRPKIEILRLNGEVLCTFQLNESGSIFTEPKCIGLSPDSSWMYVTDLTKMCLFRLSRLGNVTGTFGRHRYMGLAVSAGGSVYACSKSSNSVFQLPDDLSEDEAVLTINDDIKAPIALAISNVKKMLYVSCGSSDANVSNKLHVFKIKPKTNNYSADNGSDSI